MESFFKNIKTRFKQKDLLIQLIVINVAIFLALGLWSVIATLFQLTGFSPIKYIGISSDIGQVITKPWTLISYMFVHEGVFHILFNMLILYIFGQIFLKYFSIKNLGSLYILGGLAGAILYIIAFNTIPFYLNMGHAPMIGASASVSAIIFAAAFYKPNLEVRLLFFGGIKIIYIAIFLFILDFISLGKDSNPGGHVAHIGGALIGYVYAKQYLKGKDITKWMSHIIDWIVNLFKSKPKKKTNINISYKRDVEYKYNKQRKKENNNIDTILDKIKSSGYTSLTDEEKKRLFDASQK